MVSSADLQLRNSPMVQMFVICLLVSLSPDRHISSPVCHSIFSELYRKKSRDNAVGRLPDIEATKLSSEQRAIYDQIIRALGHRRGPLRLWLRNAELPSHSHAKDLHRLPE
jgi:hypothetical protein